MCERGLKPVLDSVSVHIWRDVKYKLAVPQRGGGSLNAQVLGVDSGSFQLTQLNTEAVDLQSKRTGEHSHQAPSWH